MKWSREGGWYTNCRPYMRLSLPQFGSVFSSERLGGGLDHLQQTEILCVYNSFTFLSCEKQFWEGKTVLTIHFLVARLKREGQLVMLLKEKSSILGEILVLLVLRQESKFCVEITQWQDYNPVSGYLPRNLPFQAIKDIFLSSGVQTILLCY